MTPLTPVTVLPQLSLPGPKPSAKAARDFEASLIASVLESMQKAYSALPGEDTFAGSENYSFLATQALGIEIAAHGGFGIAEMISRYFASHPDKK